MANLPRPLKQHLYPDSRRLEIDNLKPAAVLEDIARHYPDELFGPRREKLSIGEYLVLLAHGLGCDRDEIASTGLVAEPTAKELTAELDELTHKVHSEIAAFALDPTQRLEGDPDGVETAFAMGAAVMHENDWRKTGDPYIAHAAMVGGLAQAAARRIGSDSTTVERCLTAGLWHDGAERFDSLSAKAEKDDGQRISRFAIPGASDNAALLATYRSADDFYRMFRDGANQQLMTPADTIGAVTKRIYLGYEKEPHNKYIARFTVDLASVIVKLAGDGVHNLADPKPVNDDDNEVEKNRLVRQKYSRDLLLLHHLPGGFDLAGHLEAAGAVMQDTFDRYGSWLEQPTTVKCLESLGASAVALERLPYDPEALSELQALHLSQAA